MANVRRSNKQNTSGANPKYDAYKVINEEPVDKSAYTPEDHIWLEYWVTRHNAGRLANEKLAALEADKQTQITPKQQKDNNAKMAEVLANHPELLAALQTLVSK